jgi:hypothetical protein
VAHVSPAPRRSSILVLAAVTVALAAPAMAQTQQATPAQHQHAPAPAAMSKAEVEAFAKVEVAIANARDTTQARLAMTRNKKDETQRALRDTLVTQIAGILQKAGMTEKDYQRKLFYVSTDSTVRRQFDESVSKITGVPLPGILAAAPTVKVPAGEVGAHIAPIINGFKDAPGGQSLLSVATIEARTASQHATLGMRAPTNLEALKTHAGHVINALDPSIVAVGPGTGFGLKKAAAMIQQDIEAAAATAGASPNVKVHATHVATSAKNTLARIDAAVTLAQRIQSATTAEEAAKLMTQLVSLTAQLQPGADANNDGRIGWQENEGGIQQAEEHVKLLLAGENIP